LTGDSLPAKFWYNLTKNLTAHLYDNPCAVLPKVAHHKLCIMPKILKIKNIFFKVARSRATFLFLGLLV